MSFVRFGQDDSQVYIYEDADLGVSCCFCPLTERLPDRTDAEMDSMWLPAGADPKHWRARWAPDFATRDLDAMLTHLQQHRDAGHTIPAWLDQHLRDRWPYPAGLATAPGSPAGEA